MLTIQDKKLNALAQHICRRHRFIEWKLVQVIQKIDASQMFKRLGYSSLFQYAVQELDLTESVAFNVNAVARKALVVPQLQTALCKQSLSLARAGRIVSAITPENAEELISFARTHTQREVDFEVARWNPKAKRKGKTRVMSENEVELTITISKAEYEALKRLQSLEAQKNKPTDESVIIGEALTQRLHREDPVKKAERATPKPCEDKPSVTRITFKAHEKHEVHRRDQGRCTFILPNGKRCCEDRYTHIHHIRPVSEGGSNHPDNLTTLCWQHHDLIHQMEFWPLS